MSDDPVIYEAGPPPAFEEVAAPGHLSGYGQPPMDAYPPNPYPPPLHPSGGYPPNPYEQAPPPFYSSGGTFEPVNKDLPVQDLSTPPPYSSINGKEGATEVPVAPPPA